MNKTYAKTVSLTLYFLFSSVAYADETEITDPSVTDTEITQTIGTSIVKEGKLTQEFSEFLGGEEQAASVVEG